MNNKVLVKITIPEIEIDFDVFLPVNEIVWKIKKMLVKAICDITDVEITANDYILLNKNNGEVYKNNDVIINTNIRNSSELILLSKNNN